MVPRSLWEAVQFLAFCMSVTAFQGLSKNTFSCTDGLLLAQAGELTQSNNVQTGILHTVLHVSFQHCSTASL